MKIIEYKLHGNPNGRGMVTPSFVKEGGHYNNPDDNTYIGVLPEPCEWYVPDTVQELTLAELKTRVLAMSAKYPYYHPRTVGGAVDEKMTNEEVEAGIDEWYAYVTKLDIK